MFDDVVVVYKFLGDLMFFVTGDQDENEVGGGRWGELVGVERVGCRSRVLRRVNCVLYNTLRVQYGS